MLIRITASENAFNSINRNVMLHSLKFICPIIPANIIKCYAITSRLFVVGGKILPGEGTTQGDPTAMGTLAFGILPLVKFLLEFINLNEKNAKAGFDLTGRDS